MNSELEKALSFDSLTEAERITGGNYKEDESLVWLGMALGQKQAQEKDALLFLNRDTHRGQSFQEWRECVEEMGFDLVLEEPIQGTPDLFRIFWREGALLTSGSYWGGKSVNSANLYLNYKGPREALNRCSSGFVKEVDGIPVWDVEMNSREGLRHGLQTMEEAGEILPRWIKSPFLWLLNYTESKTGEDYERINASRISMLPEYVREAITP